MTMSTGYTAKEMDTAVRAGAEPFSRELSLAFHDKSKPYGAHLTALWSAASEGEDDEDKDSLNLKSGALWLATRLYRSMLEDEQKKIVLSGDEAQAISNQIVNLFRQIWGNEDTTTAGTGKTEFATVLKNLKGIVGPTERRSETPSAVADGYLAQ